MNITLEYLAQLRTAAGKRSETVTGKEGTTLGAVLAEAATRLGPAFTALVFDGHGNLHPSLLVMLNEEQVVPDRTRTLRDSDRVTLLTPMSGG